MINTNSFEENYNKLYNNINLQSSNSIGSDFPFPRDRDVPKVFPADFSVELKKKLNLEQNVVTSNTFPLLKPPPSQQTCKAWTSSLKNNSHQIPSTLSASVSPVRASYPAVIMSKATNINVDSQQQPVIDLMLSENPESRYSNDTKETNTVFSQMRISVKSSSLQNNIYKDANCKYEKTPMHTELMAILSKASGNQLGSAYSFDNCRVGSEIQDRSNCRTKSCNSSDFDSRIYNNTRSCVNNADIYGTPSFESNAIGLVRNSNAGYSVNICNYSNTDERIRNDNVSFNVYDSVPDNDIYDETEVIQSISPDNNLTNPRHSWQREQGTSKNIYDPVSSEYHQRTSYYDAVEDDSLSSIDLTAPLNAVSIDF